MEKMNSSTVSQHPKKATQSLISEKQHLISCVYIADVNNGGLKQTSVVNLRSNSTLADITNPSTSLSPLAIQGALASSKASLLNKSGYIKCLTCDDKASHVCSSVTVSRGIQNSCNTSEQCQLLIVSECLICSCGDGKCVSEARRRRNQTALKKGEHGYGFKFTFRCAVKPIRRVLDATPSAMGRPHMSSC
jgi:hypothetical protein